MLSLLALAAVASAGIRPPVIHEPFTVLPCPPHPVSTVDLEGCAERALLASDLKIDGRARAIVRLLPTAAARRSFAAGEREWLAYRRSSCAAEASRYAGGTVLPVVVATCERRRDGTHLADLAAMQRALAHP